MNGKFVENRLNMYQKVFIKLEELGNISCYGGKSNRVTTFRFFNLCWLKTVKMEFEQERLHTSDSD